MKSVKKLGVVPDTATDVEESGGANVLVLEDIINDVEERSERSNSGWVAKLFLNQRFLLFRNLGSFTGVLQATFRYYGFGGGTQDAFRVVPPPAQRRNRAQQAPQPGSPLDPETLTLRVG